MKRFLLLLLPFVVTLARAQTVTPIKQTAEINGQPYYSTGNPAKGAAWKPYSGTATGGGSGTYVSGPVAFTNLTGVPSYLTSGALAAKLETALYNSNRTADQAATAAALAAGNNAQIGLNNHVSNSNNPHGTTKDQVGLSNVPNVNTTNPANIIQSPGYRFVTDAQINTWNSPPTNSTANVSAATVRSYLSAGNGLLYDQSAGQYYINASDVNVIVKSYLKSRDGYAAGKVLQADGNEFTWVTPTSTTVTGGSSGTVAPGGSVVSADHIFADSTVSRSNPGVMTDVLLTNTADLLTFITTPQTNKRGILTNAATPYDNGSGGFSRTGAWTNVMLTAQTSATLISTGTNVMTFQGSNTVNRVYLKGITFKSTNTGGGYPMVFTNELVSFDGLEIGYCKFVGTNTGNFNGFGVIQYSTSSNSGGTSANLYLHDNEFIDIPRCGVEILSQGYDAVRLTNVTIAANRFRNSAANSGEFNRMATSLSGLITNIYHARNHSTNAKNMAYEFVNVKYAKGESNTAVASLETCVGYSVSDDGRNSTEQIYLEGGYFNVTSRPFQLYDCKDVHIKGGLYIAGRGIDMNTRLSSIESITATCTNLFNAEAIVQFGGTSNNNVLKSSVLSSWGSAALGREPSYETVVLRSGTYANVVSGTVAAPLILRQGKRPGGGYFTDGQVVNQGTASPANTVSGTITVQLEP
ncbi:hypothetical protein [Fibrella forsythiae]|uniref:Right-handed parallel beta-helix repeat-containing protein n=1 Tax=Fibrella forsythiae TaxID=2817061 RepID=A0ABS3JBY3_9BACT|nr:hypothetical protein [Fibrella forsythiae]MBO0947493.1 hypothetical protein [Fibrella forsythiae]